jgi:hypothetical protein
LVALVLVQAGCGLAPGSSTMYFPTHERGPTDALPAARITASLVVDDGRGCVWIDGQDGVSYLVLWPPGYRLESVGGAWQVLDGSGAVIAENGGSITIGGGEFINPAVVSEFGAEEPPPECLTGEFWVAAGLP